MKAYEGFFILPPEATPEVRSNQLKLLEDLINKSGGTVSQKMEWGKKPLGYSLRKFREGYFVIVEFKMPGPNTVEFQKTLPLQEEILKFMITTKRPDSKKQAVTPAPSAARMPHPSQSAGPQAVPTRS